MGLWKKTLAMQRQRAERSRNSQKIEEASHYEKDTHKKISQIKNEILVIGSDIGKETHYARAFDNRGDRADKITAVQQHGPRQ